MRLSEFTQVWASWGSPSDSWKGEDVHLRRACFDSRKVQRGDLFCALPGLQHNGDMFLAEALRKGACAVMRTGAPQVLEVPEFLIDLQSDPAEAAGWAAHFLAGKPSEEMMVVAVTGTNGKTTLVHLLEQAMTQCGIPAARSGTLGLSYRGEERSTPNTTPAADVLHSWLADIRTQGAKALVLEASSHGLDQKRLAGLPVDLVGWTNLTQDHLDYHHSMEEYAKAKARLVHSLPAEGHAFLPFNHALVQGACRGARCGMSSWSLDSSDADLRGQFSVVKEGGLQLLIEGEWGNAEIMSPMVGKHNAANLLLAFGLMRASGASAEEAARALGALQGAPGRLEEVAPESDWHLFVDYAHTPDALSHAVDALREVYPESKIGVVFGAGGDRDQDKRPLMGEAVATRADWCVITSDNPRTENPSNIVDAVAQGARFGSANVSTCTDRRAAIQMGLNRLRPGDVLLLAGKGHEPYQEIHGVREPFDDRIELAEAARCQ